MENLQGRGLNIYEICMCLIVFETCKSLLQTSNVSLFFKHLIIDRIVKSRLLSH